MQIYKTWKNWLAIAFWVNIKTELLKSGYFCKSQIFYKVILLMCDNKYNSDILKPNLTLLS